MKHIKDILVERQLSLFVPRKTEKGSREWSAFNSIAGDHVDAFPTRTPYKPEIRYGNVVKIHRVRNPHSLFPKHAQ